MSKSFVRVSFAIALLCAFTVSEARADSFVVAKATLDWSGFTFSVSNGLSIDSIVYGYQGSSTHAQTSHGAGDSDFGGLSSFAASSYVNSLGWATATGGVDNGALTSSSEAAAEAGAPTFNAAAADAFASAAFWLYGSGQGLLTVEVPYELLIEANVDQSSNELASGAASVSLQLGPGTNWYASDSLTWSQDDPLFSARAAQLTGGPMVKTGTLTLTRYFYEPNWGPLVYIGAGASTTAVTAVPEPSALALLGVGAFSVLAARRRFRP